MQVTPQKQFVCHFVVNLSNLRTQSNGDFYKNFYLATFMYAESCFVILQHILATVQPKIHLNTKFEILPFGWTKCPKIEPFFFEIALFIHDFASLMQFMHIFIFMHI